MERQSGLSELSVISWVSAIQGCPLSGVPLYTSHGYYLRLVFISLRAFDCVATIHTLIVLLMRNCMIWSGSFVGPSGLCVSLSVNLSVAYLGIYVCLSISLYLYIYMLACLHMYVSPAICQYLSTYLLSISLCVSAYLPLSVDLPLSISTSLSPPQLTGVVEKLMEQLQQKGKELNEFRQKHNIQVKEERDSAKTSSDSREKTGASQGVLVS